MCVAKLFAASACNWLAEPNSCIKTSPPSRHTLLEPSHRHQESCTVNSGLMALSLLTAGYTQEHSMRRGRRPSCPTALRIVPLPFPNLSSEDALPTLSRIYAPE